MLLNFRLHLPEAIDNGMKYMIYKLYRSCDFELLVDVIHYKVISPQIYFQIKKAIFEHNLRENTLEIR